MHTRALRRQHFPPQHAVRRVRLLAWNIHMGLTPQAAAKRLGFTEAELQQALAHADFEVCLADIASLVTEGLDAMNANLVAAAACTLEQLVYECEPRVCLYLCHCHAEGRNGLRMIVEAAERAMTKLREAKEAKPPEPATELPPCRPRPPEPRTAATMRKINLDLRDRLLAVYASIVDARAAEAADRPKRQPKPRGGLLYGSTDELIRAAMARHRPATAPPDSS